MTKASLDVYPNVHTLIKLMLTIPCTTASGERSLSGLGLLKTYLRNRCGEKRLSAIALMFLHRDIQVDYDEVVDDFLRRKQRR